MDSRVRWTLTIQALMTVIAAGGFAAFYGGVGTWWMARGIDRAGALLAVDSPDQGARALYRGLVQKYIFIIAVLAMGMGLLKLSPVPLLVAFVATQAGFLLAAIGTPQPK